MTNKQAKLLWEDVLNNGKGNNVIIKFNINREEAKIFLEYTKPEMFVSKEINAVNKLEIKKLEQKVSQISNIIKKKKSSSSMFNLMFILYFITVFPILSLIVFLKYFA